MKLLLIGFAIFALAGFGAFIFMGYHSRSGEAPGLSGMHLKPCGGTPNCVSSVSPQNSDQYIAAFAVSPGTEDAAWAKLVAAIGQLGGVVNENAPPYLAATFTSKVFGFVDDLECVIEQQAGAIQVRSGARVGYSDLDVNRTRVEQLREIISRS